MGMKYHPAAEIFPLLEGPEFAELVADIRANGLREPIWTKDGAILDGRNRYRACLEAGIDPRFREYEGGDVIAFVVSLNLKRRHLNESQRAMVAANIATIRQGQRTDLSQICGKSQDEAAELLSVSPRSVSNAARVKKDGAPELSGAVSSGNLAVSLAAEIAKLPVDRQREILKSADRRAIKKVHAEQRQEEIEANRIRRFGQITEKCKRNSPLDGSLGKFAVVYADPPWRYHNSASDSRKIENHYPTMAIEDIKHLPVSDLVVEPSVLFLWVPVPLLPEGLSVVEAWGYSYSTAAVWDKEIAGMGYFFRQQAELLVVGTRGSMPCPPTSARPASVIRARRRAHSQKPDEAYEIIEAMYPGLPKMELFARNERPGWKSWGNEVADARE